MSPLLDGRSTPSLYDLDALEQELMALIEDQDGEVTPEQQALFDQWERDRAIKTDAYYHVATNYRASAKALRDEAAKLADRADVYDARADRTESRLKNYLVAHGLDRMKGQVHHCYLAVAGGIQKLKLLVGIEQIPDPWKRVTTLVAPDQEKIRQAIAAGEANGLAELEPRRQLLKWGEPTRKKVTNA
jgi:hypothetical protein